MTTPDLSHTIPRRLDDTGKFLFWERDVAGLGLLGTLAGVGIGYPLSDWRSDYCSRMAMAS
jgi:conjugal transfer pilus assembly protein TraL